MKQSMFGKALVVSCACILLMASSSWGKEEPVLSAEGETLLATYTQMLEALKKEVAAGAPKVDAAKKAAFVEAHGKIGKLPKLPNPQNLKMAPVTYCRGNEAYAEAQAELGLVTPEQVAEVDESFTGQALRAMLKTTA